MVIPRHLRRVFPWVIVLVALANPLAAQTVSMVPYIAMPVTYTFPVYVYLDSDFEVVQGVEVSMTFDPTIVHLDGIAPGDWFTGSGLEYFFWDHTTPGTDTIHFAGALLQMGQVADGVLGVCTFTALAGGVSPVDFVDVDVRDADNLDLGAGHSTGDQIVIDLAIADESLCFGEVKALYR
jgi:hypothetical protein